MILDWIFSPYSSSGLITKEVCKIFGLKLREWNLAEIRDAQLVMLPRHVSEIVKSIRREHKHTHINGAEPLFFLDNKFIGSHSSLDTLTAKIIEAGGTPEDEPNIPETFVHPRLNHNRDDPSVMVKPLTARDIAGQGLPSPCLSCDNQFGKLGSPEATQFMLDMTRHYGRMMSVAFIGSEVAGYIVHLPKPVCWRIGCRHVNNIKDMRVLQIFELFVYPQFQDRRDVKTSLLEHTRQFAKKTRLAKIEVFASTNPSKIFEHALPTGDSQSYLNFGFIKKREISPADGLTDNTEKGLGITQLMLSI